MEIPYHYPPELLDLLVDTIPLLTRSKKGVIDFLRGAGIEERYLLELRHQVAQDSSAITKYAIVRRVLNQINAGGDSTLRERREIVKRVVEFDDYSSCWPDDGLKAAGLVARIAKLVNARDTVSRIAQERNEERLKRIAAAEARLAEKKTREARRARRKREILPTVWGEGSCAPRTAD